MASTAWGQYASGRSSCGPDVAEASSVPYHRLQNTQWRRLPW